MKTFLEPDWIERGALVGAVGEQPNERVVAVANYVRLRDPRAAEVAFAVADELQGHGLGTRLLEQLAIAAAEAGVSEFVAEVLPSNRAMLAVFENAGFEIARRVEAGEVEVRLAIEPTARYQQRVDERDHASVVASLRPFFAPRTVAVIGASPRRGSIGGELFRNILAGDFAGAAFPVNRTGAPVAGVRGYRSLHEIPDEVELAIVCVPAERVLDAVEDILEHSTRALCVISAGFAESGSEGATRQERLMAAVRAHGARLIGPNCLGLAVNGVRLNATFAPRAFPPGTIGFSSQSGALGLALLEVADSRGLGVSAFVSIGNKADVSSNDLLEYWEDDDATKLVLLYLESFGNPRKFARIARRISRRKPILAMKSGRTGAGARAAGSHTAALAGSEAAVNALFAQAGVLRAETLGELVDVAALLSTQPLPRGRRVAVLTNAGGLGILCADACEASGLELPPLEEETRRRLGQILPPEASLANPVDMLGSATAREYERSLPLLLADQSIDAVIVLFVPPVTASAEEVAQAVARGAATTAAGKPVLASIIARDGIPPQLLEEPRAVAAFRYPESAARALGRAARRAEWLRRHQGEVPTLSGIDRGAAETVVERVLEQRGQCWLEPDETSAVLTSYGVSLVDERHAADADAAVAAAAELGYPVVVKSAVAGAHKTERGAVVVGLAEEDAVRSVTARIGPPVIVQRQIVGGVELLAGALQDPLFGPLVAFGPGGVLAELIGDAEFRLAPLTDVDGEELVTFGKAGRLVHGFRGAPAADTRALTDLLHRLGRLIDDLPAIAEVDLNPVIAGPDGYVAVDARMLVRPSETQAPAKSW